jgi:hypothetical protein
MREMNYLFVDVDYRRSRRRREEKRKKGGVSWLVY